ncbi:hypothetical protein ACIBL5_38180 [Streptomyces sp. NPDC050516]|uniref:hypothetical protein n=1 Tax=Streptomyces sp. NPDC050516 TaxID=3365621 RepID=UPI00378A21F5
MMWTQTEPGGDAWSHPEPLGIWPAGDAVSRCLPRLDVIRDGQGRLHVIAMRSVVGADHYDHLREVMHVQQDVADGPFGAWQSLGSPHEQHNFDRRRAVGIPVAVATGAGNPLVVLRNFGTGLSARNSFGQAWGNWRDLHGGTLDGACALTLKRGITEIYATTKTGMLRWYQQAPGGPLLHDYGTLLPRPAGSVTLLEQTDGRLVMIARQPSTGWLVAHRQREAGGAWNPQAELLDTTPGYGPIVTAELPQGGGVILIQRRDDGNLSISRQPLDGSPFHPQWTPVHSGPFVHTPSAAFDTAGRLVIAVIGPDADLHTLLVDQQATEPAEPAALQAAGK